MKQKHFYSFISFLIVFVFFNSELKAQYNKHLTGNYNNDTIFIVPDTNKTGLTIYLTRDSSVYAYACIDSTNYTLTCYHPLWIDPSGNTFHEKGDGSFTTDFNTIYGNAWVQRIDGTIVFGPIHDIFTRDVTGIGTMTNETHIKCWPNPVIDKLFFTVSEASRKTSVRIYDLAGECIYNSLYTLNTTNQSIDVVNFKPGMYFLQMTDAENITTLKFVKQ